MCVNLVIPHLLIVLTDVTLEDVMHKNVKVKRGGKKKGEPAWKTAVLCLCAFFVYVSAALPPPARD